MKTNGMMDHSNQPCLLDQYKQTWADYISKWIDAYKAQGLPIKSRRRGGVGFSGSSAAPHPALRFSRRPRAVMQVPHAAERAGEQRDVGGVHVPSAGGARLGGPAPRPGSRESAPGGTRGATAGLPSGF